MVAVFRRLGLNSARGVRCYSVRNCGSIHRCKLLVVGGGTGGCSLAWRFSRKLGPKEIIVLDPSKVHYYQPMFTLVAAGMNNIKQTHRPTEKVLPPNVAWFRDHAQIFEPCNNMVHTRCGHKICYEFMVIGLGLINDYDKIPGLKKALDDPNSCVSTIYSPDYCCKTWCCLKNWRGGHAVFTFPAQSGKCPGAAQKIMYLADDYWRTRRLRDLTNITYTTGGQKLFGVPKYEKSLIRIAENRKIAVNCNTELLEVTPKEAIFRTGCLKCTLPYNFLHVTPPMCTPPCLRDNLQLTNQAGYLDVDMYTLQHRTFSNIYGIGDCTTTPNSKTAAAIAGQSFVVEQNLTRTMGGRDPCACYDGYCACPVLTSYKKGIIAEFVYDKKPQETFPLDQSKERRLFLLVKKYWLPYLYWNKLLTGKWDGPSKIRKIINPLGR